MKIIGISAYYHDSAATILVDGEIIAAAQEERFTRKKHDADFPVQALQYCIKEARCDWKDIDYVAFYDKPFLKFDRLLETYLAFAPRGFSSFRTSMPLWVREKLFLKSVLVDALESLAPEIDWHSKILFSEHHLSHAASAYFPSPFDCALVLTLDGVGEWATTSVALGNKNQLQVHKQINFPHSLGLLYSAFTYYTGFKVNSGEYKVMGLAPYGEPKYAALIRDHLIDIKADGSFRLNMDYFDYCTGLTMTNQRFHQLFEGEPRKASDPVTQKIMDLAASVQVITEEVILKLTSSLAREFPEENLCLAGGVALNCVANGKILRAGKFKNIWIQPAAGDAGGALGAAYVAQHILLKNERKVSSADKMRGAYLGAAFSETEIENELKAIGAHYEKYLENDLVVNCAKELAQGKILGWHQGRVEFGPRALGARSILGDPRNPKMQSVLNLKIKYRESFRPFAPAILREDLAQWFELDVDSPYMLLVAEVVPGKRIPMTASQESLFGIDKLNVLRSQIPAVTHVDYSARVQTVHRDTNAVFYDLLKRFKQATGCPVLVNTSFNVRGEPIVQSPTDAFHCFMNTEMDLLAVGNFLLRKEAQSPDLKSKKGRSFADD